MALDPLPQDLASHKVVQLKELLKERSLPVSGTKAQLISRLQENDTNQDRERENGEELQEDTETNDKGDKRRPLQDEQEDEERENKRARVGEEVDQEMENPKEEEEEKVAVPSFDSAPAPKTIKEEKGRPVNESILAEEGEGAIQGGETKDTENSSNGHEAVISTNQEVVAEEGTTERQEEGEKMVERQDEVVQAEEEKEEDEVPDYSFPEEDDSSSRPTDMYLDTINRSSLDFDFERLCSVTLSHNNIYCCLVDGKYFQGRGKKSAAYAHSIGEDHHVFINLETRKVYVLPDGYEVSDPSLSDIQYLLSPTFTRSQLISIDRRLTPLHDLHQTPYHPGFVGLNNIKSNSYINSILLSLSHVRPLRDYFILSPLVQSSETSELVRRFGLFLRKCWSDKMFKNQVSPHELLQQIDLDSKGRFRLTDEKGDPQEFLGWFLNTLHKDLGGNKKRNSSIIYSCFQGSLRVDDQQVLKSGEYGSKPVFDLSRDIKTLRTPFLFLTLDLPPPPLFQSHLQNDIIPQIPLTTLLSKYSGSTTQELLTPKEDGRSEVTLRRFKIEELPEFVVLNVKRFERNRFGEEKNPTIVNFPLRGVDFRDYVESPDNLSKFYDLVSNVTHTSLSGTARAETQWKTYVHLTPPRDKDGEYVEGVKEEDEKWFEMQDLVVQEIERNLVGLGESYIQIWERRRPEGNHEGFVEVMRPKQKVKGVAGQTVPKK